MKRTITKPANNHLTIGSIWLLNLLYVLCLYYIDEGNYHFNKLFQLRELLIVVLSTSIFTLISCLVFSVLKKMGARWPMCLAGAFLTVPLLVLLFIGFFHCCYGC